MHNVDKKQAESRQKDLSNLTALQIKHLGVTDDAEDVKIDEDLDWKGER